MKVALITKYFLPVKGGIENHCANLAIYLHKLGIDVEIHTSRDNLTERNILPTFEVFNSGVKVYRHSRFWKFSDIEKFDIVHLHNFNIFPHMLIFLKVIIQRKILNKKTPAIIVTLHGGFNPWWEEFSLFKRIIKKAYHLTLGRFLLNFAADYIIVLNEQEKKRVIPKISKTKILVIPNGVEDDAYKLPRFNLDDNIGKYHPYILFIGRISPVKNIEEIIKYVSKLKEVNLIIAGPIQDKVYFNRLHAISRQLNVDGRIKYIGEVLGEHKYKLIDNSIAVILLSKQEADPIVVKEAITRGKPVLINKLLQLSFFKKSMECIFVINDVSTFRKLLIDILTNQKKYLKSGHRCRIKAKEWKWETVAKRTFKVYKTSLGGKVKWKPKNIRSGYSR